MKRIVRVFCLFLACMLLVTNASIVNAEELSEIEDKIDKAEEEENALKEQKKAVEEEKEALKSKLSSLAAELTEASEKLEKKQLEIAETQDKLDAAKIEESQQYEAMKLRIQFMYENGDTDMIELLCESKSITELLNKAEYIKQTSEYDREKLIEFQETVKKIEEAEAKLEEEQKELETLQDNLISKQNEVNALLKEANLELASLEKELGSAQDKIDDLLAQAERARQQQSGSSSGGGTAGASKVIGNGTLAWPTTSRRITCYFGWRTAPVAGATSWHDAIDIGAPIGTPVYAVAAGKVITAAWGYNGGRGNYVMVDHGNGLVTRYQHLSTFYVKVGQKVTKGQNIAAVGNTGASSGPHLDYAIYVNGSAIDPMRYY